MTGDFKKLLIFILFILFLFPAFLSADELYDAPGFDPHRETFTSMPNEHIDTFTGGLILTFEDIRLPGNGGLDLVIQRTYNSKNTCNEWREWLGVWSCSSAEENTWLGYAWTLHFGKLFYSTNTNVPHVIEMPDGSRHTVHNRTSGPGGITRDYWILDVSSTPDVVTLTNGTKIYYGQHGTSHKDFPKHSTFNATKIEDVNGNAIQIYYKSSNSDEISHVIDSVGRRIDFKTETINSSTRLVAITGPEVSIQYVHKPLTVVGNTVLIEARPPEGNPWKYAYHESLFELTELTTPTGGVIRYTYDSVKVDMGFTFHYRTVVEKETAGTLPSGKWTFAYSQGINKDYTQIIDPCRRTIKYGYYGYGTGLPNGSMWKIGLPKSKEVVGEEAVTYDWAPSAYISMDDYVVPYVGRDYYIYVPFMTKKSITRDGETYTTNYNNYDSYGNPKTISETGDKIRNRELTYWYNIPKNIVQNKPLSETVSGSFPGTLITTYAYDPNKGNLLQLNRYGVITQYTYYLNGNLRTQTDANGKTTSYMWTNGRISKITNPLYSISRFINPNGTLASETNGRGYKTSFTYDGNLRLKTITPPGVNPTNFTYPQDNSYKLETRGQYYTYHYNDGFGRPTGTEDIKGIETDMVYKSCGLRDYSTSNIGDTVYYDPFGRVKQITHKDNTKITYDYLGSDVTLTDEAGYKTPFTYNAFGNPDDKLLVSVNDALLNVTSYDYNTLGSLLTITQRALQRTFSYDEKNFLRSESHPERETIVYTRDNVGNLKMKTDGLGMTTYTYDAINLLKVIDSKTEVITFDYDHADNRTGMSNASATTIYTYDGANRLTEKEETLLGRTSLIQYGYDGNDNLTDIYYPSGNHVIYVYNPKNLVTDVRGAGWSVNNITYWATGTSIGLPQSFTYSNGLTTNLTYNKRNLTTDIEVGAPALDMGYEYDTRGNMKFLANYLDPSKNQTLGYDNLNRMTSFDGLWGMGSFGYDSLGNRRLKKIAAVNTDYQYLSNRLISTTGGEPFSFDYNGDGDLTYLKNMLGMEYSLKYDKFHNLLSYEHNAGTVASFTYDGDGMRVTKTSGNKTTVYEYDKEGRVISEADGSGSLLSDYVYLNGKLIAKITSDAGAAGPKVFVGASDGTKLSLTESSAKGSNSPITMASTSEGYSISGKVLTSKKNPVEGVTITVNGAATATAQTDSSGNYTVSGLINGTYTLTPSKTGYSFTPVKRTVTIRGANITRQDFTVPTYSISGKVIKDNGASFLGVTVTAAGELTTQTTTTNSLGNYTLVDLPKGAYTVKPEKEGFVFNPESRSVTISRANVSGQNFQAFPYVAGQKVLFYHTDPTGTPLVMTDEGAKVVWRAEYKPFGEEFEVTPDPENNRMFVGKEMDKETGLYYFGARYMEPMTGRFISPDPVGPVDPKTGKKNEKVLRNPQSINLYAYGLNNPFKYIDPDGMEVYFIGAGASASIGNIGPIAKKDQRGYGTQAGYGIAYDTETKKIILFATGGTANQTEDKVIGANVGIGFFGGKIEGNLQDFLGESREISKTFIAVTKTDIETSTNKEGMAFSVGGKGAGFSYTSITTTTFNLIERVKEMTKKEKE